MISRFADTFYFIALLSPDDEAHAHALELSAQANTQLVTTTWVLTEVGDAFCDPGNRELFLGLLELLRNSPAAEIVPASESLFNAGVSLYAQRSDKHWSLTDCISFAVMEEYGITEALTGDSHFVQAGFVPLMR